MPTPTGSGRKPNAKARPVFKKAAKKPVAKKARPAFFTVSSLPGFEPLAILKSGSGVSVKLFSRLTGFSERAIADWKAGKPVSDPARRRLLEVERFRKRLGEVVSAEAIPAWLDTPNEAFEGLKPVEVIERGEIDRLWNMIFYMESGVAS